MESLTKFLDPKSIPEITGDEIDLTASTDAMAGEFEKDVDSDTIVVKITNSKPDNVDLDRIKLPGTKSDDNKSMSKVDQEKFKLMDLAGEEEQSSEETSVKVEVSNDGSGEQVEISAENSEESSESEEPVETDVESGDADSGSSDTEADNEEAADDVEKEEKTEEAAEQEESVSDPESDESEENAEEAAETENPENDLSNLDNDESPEPLLKVVHSFEFNGTTIYKLPNGAKIVYINRPGELCNVQFKFNVGSYYEDDSNRGVSHLLEHLMFNSCPGMSSMEFNRNLDKLGMSVNAYTGRTETNYVFSGLKANFVPAFELYVRLLKSFTVTQEILDKEKGVVINEIGVYKDDNWTVLKEAVFAQAYRQHPITHPILGYEGVIRNLTVDAVQSWYDNNYSADNLELYLTGDFTEEDLVFAADKLQIFESGNKNVYPIITDSMTLPFVKNVIAYKEGIQQTLIWSSLPFDNKAYNYFELNMLTEVLGGTMSSYLWKEFREDRSIAYSVGAYFSGIDKDHLKLNLYAGLNDPEDAELAKTLFANAFEFAKNISEDDFIKGSTVMLTEFYSGLQSITSFGDFVQDLLLYGFDLDEYVSAIKNLSYDSYLTFSDQIDIDRMVTGILYPMDFQK